jgi:hypothetical protein
MSKDGQDPQEIRYDGVHCNLAISRFSCGVIVLRISGSDVGEFKAAPMLALNDWLAGSDPIALFIDARDVRGASIEVSGEWARWLSMHRPELKAVTMLTGSRFIQMTADFVRRFAELEAIMRIYANPVAFDSALARALGPAKLSRDRGA